MKTRRSIYLAATLIAADLILCVAAATAGTTPDAVTISLSGSTAMRNFTTSQSFTALTPGRSITLANGHTYTAMAADPATGTFPAVQLGATFNDTYPVPNPLEIANYRALRVEWHEQGSVEGILELANDQIGTLTSVSLSNRNPSVGNPTWVNGSIGGALTAAGTNSGGFTIASSTYNTYTDYDAAGVNLQGGQNRVQMAISDVTARQGFSVGGANGAWNRTPGQAGYGKGNSALLSASNISGTGKAGSRKQLNDQSVLNMSTDKVNPSTGSNYAEGAWNTAGVENLKNVTVATSATTFAANPGTGLTKLNRTDAQFLQATGRLANGADFNVATRDVNSGTLNVAASNVGLDPSFAVGENDGGDTGAIVGATDPQQSIGSGIRFSGKTSGGTGLRPTVQNSRMAIGHLGISDARNTSANNATSPNNVSRPLRVLAYRDDANDTADASNAALSAGFADPASGTFVKPSFDTITDGTYALYQNQTYVTVREPDAALYNQDKIKGDNTSDDVRDFRDNILASAGTYPASSSFLNPANGMIAQGFIPTQYMKVRKDIDGLNQSVANASFDAANYPAIQSQAAGSFAVADAAAVTTGNNSTYGNIAAANGGILIDAENYLFGDFDNDGDRDFADVKTAADAQDRLAATAAGATYAIGSGQTNTQAVTGLTGALATMNAGAGANRGDLIVKGDFDSNGKFDGKDLYLFARGAALADNTSSNSLSIASGATFADQVRHGVLRKNAALDYMNTAATAQQRGEASADGIVGNADDVNAFNKFDVNRDGAIDRFDAQLVDASVGKNITSLDDQLGSTVGVDGKLKSTGDRRSLSLVDAELDDNLVITSVLSNGTSDFKLILNAVGTGIVGGDANFSGKTDFDDLLILASVFNTAQNRWSKADFNLDGQTNFNDLLVLAANFNKSATVNLSQLPDGFAAEWALAQTLVPEPTSIAVGLAGLALATIRRRRRRVG